MKNIVITADTSVGGGLELIRAIKREVNCKAYVLCTSRSTVPVFEASKLVDEVLFVEDITEKKYIDAIKLWYPSAKFKEKPILYFTTDKSCYYIDRNRGWFEERFELCLPSSSIIKNYTQKGLAEAEALKAGLSVPKTQIIDNNEDIEKVVSSFCFPIILKPRATYLMNDMDFKIKVIKDKNEFIAYTNPLIQRGNTVLCQEFIPGGNDASYYYLFYRTRDGRLFPNMGRKTLQSTTSGGIMAKGLVEYNTKVAEMCESFLNVINYKGIGGIEFKKYKGTFYFIEMSTRLEGFYKIAEISNTPLSLLSYYDLSSNNLSNNDLKSLDLKDNKQKDGMVYMDFLMTMFARYKAKKYLALIADLLSAIFNPTIKLNVYSRKDSKPFWLTIRNLLVG